jgi:hypothetical protein
MFNRQILTDGKRKGTHGRWETLGIINKGWSNLNDVEEMLVQVLELRKMGVNSMETGLFKEVRELSIHSDVRFIKVWHQNIANFAVLQLHPNQLFENIR